MFAVAGQTAEQNGCIFFKETYGKGATEAKPLCILLIPRTTLGTTKVVILDQARVNGESN